MTRCQDTDCAGELDHGGYSCDKCNGTVVLCAECHEIYKTCPCGACGIGEHWMESE